MDQSPRRRSAGGYQTQIPRRTATFRVAKCDLQDILPNVFNISHMDTNQRFASTSSYQRYICPDPSHIPLVDSPPIRYTGNNKTTGRQIIHYPSKRSIPGVKRLES